MERFNTLTDAAELAATRCNGWSFISSGERYDANSLLTLAETSDDENPLDEDAFYVVAPSGAIGFCPDGEDIDWLFISDAAPNEDLPAVYQAAAQAKFCSNCGAPVNPGARFCGKCGGKLG